jgi:hypothetical protein
VGEIKTKFSSCSLRGTKTDFASMLLLLHNSKMEALSEARVAGEERRTSFKYLIQLCLNERREDERVLKGDFSCLSEKKERNGKLWSCER